MNQAARAGEVGGVRGPLQYNARRSPTRPSHDAIMLFILG